MPITVATIDVGGTGADSAANARTNLGAAPTAAYAQANSAANTVAIRANSASTQNSVAINFVNTSTVSVTVTAGSTGNANVSFTAADAGFNPFLLAGM